MPVGKSIYNINLYNKVSIYKRKPMFRHSYLPLSCIRMSIAEGCVFGLNLNRESPINMCTKVSCYEDMGILRLLIELLQKMDSVIEAVFLCVHQDPHV
jgi:hypothetical protein